MRRNECSDREERHTKRRRQEADDDGDNSSIRRDYYEDVLEGKFSGMVLDSWLRDVRPIYLTGRERMTDSTAGAPSLSSNIQSLSQQLLQVKRRLWPAAEQCARLRGHWGSADKEFTAARRQCNPMEPLGEGRGRGLNKLFMNRSAVKLANLDAILGFRLTCGDEYEPFLFVDLCGAPGGFSEYLMKRSQSSQVSVSCRGYGMSLIGTNEHGKGTPWRLSQSISSRNDSFQTNYRVCTGVDGTGDIYKWENVQSLVQEIQNDLSFTRVAEGGKVHLVVADGGFDAQRDSENQEEVAQKLILCEMAAALSVLRVGGAFVIKMFGFQTATMRTAMQYMFEIFREVQVLKPISSRPASSERYAVFSGFGGLPASWGGESWLNHVFLGKATTRPPGFYTPLNSYLDQIDLDMLALNLKACFAILSTLERRGAEAEAGAIDEDNWNEQHYPINTSAYQSEWKLYTM